MIAYKYKVTTKDGESKVGRIEAASVEEAEALLSKGGTRVISISPIIKARLDAEANAAKRAKGGSYTETNLNAAPVEIKRKKGKKAKSEDVVGVLRNMAVMAESSVPLKEALDTVAMESAAPDLAKALRTLRDEVVAGLPLGEAMRNHQRFFPDVVCDIVAVGEDGGSLELALTSAAEHMERSAEMRSKVINALIYPAILTAVSFLSVIALVVFVLPQFVETFRQMNIDPPMLTKILMAFGGLFRNHPLLTLGIMVGGFFGGRYALRNPVISRKLGLLLLRLPVVGDLLMKIALSRSMHTLASLTAANIRLVDALHHAGRVAGVPTLANAFERARKDLEHGETLAESLAKSRALPGTLIQLISIGERTGKLPSLLARSASQMEREADARLKSVVSLFEPALIVIMGGVIGMIVLSIITPLFSIMQKI